MAWLPLLGKMFQNGGAIFLRGITWLSGRWLPDGFSSQKLAGQAFGAKQVLLRVHACQIVNTSDEVYLFHKIKRADLLGTHWSCLGI